MGVPKFFRYTSERYPCLNELVKQSQIPDFDNMYLDMNGIIHNCSHPDDSNPHFRITEENIFADIFHYISILFQIIKPKRLFFMAIDGVAPRAKMNQQRGRRFRSAREAEQLEEKAKAKGETLPTENRFDSNCITPGTVFMARLHAQLRYFVQHKISSDPLWSKCRVILSGHETPGEGEHKIMDYIRWSRSQPDYEPGTRHCLYGLDADLIMLGMCTHEPHFALLREEVKFGKSTQRATSPEETNFYLLHLSLMRDYLRQEFVGIKERLPFEYDLEKVVDDWVLMGFLVGNDFIPNLPNMHINNDALPLLYRTYMTVLPTLDGYINEAGILHLGRFEKFMRELAKVDKEAFQETYADLRYFQEKTGRRPDPNERKEYKPNDDDTFNVDIKEIKSNKKSDDLQALINATAEMLLDELDGDGDDDEYEDISDEEANFDMEFALHKKDYYTNKLDYAKVTDEVLRSQAECYVRAIQWNLHYYYRGCASWCWFYPHHYAPYISDIRGFENLKIEFELGEPFKPFEQLLAVLPAASKALLPEPFHALMTEERSPIVHYYPVDFDTDLNGKKNDWEAVVLIPFIDEGNLLSAMEPCYARLSPEEARRNTHGPMLVYNYTQESLGEVHSPQYFPPVKDSHCTETAVWRAELDVPPEQLLQGVLPGANTDLFYPGFPTMRHLQYKTYVKKNKCKVFDQPSRNENMIVELIRTGPEPELERAARELLGRVVWVGWPHLAQAKVVSVSNEKQRLHLVKGAQNGCSEEPGEGEELRGDASFTVEPNVGNLHKQWLSERATIIEHNLGRMGIELGDISIIVHATNLKGHKFLVQSNTSLAVERVWCAVPCGYAYQAVVRRVKHRSACVTRYATPQEAFPPGARVFLTAGPYYGCLARVVSSEEVGRSGRIKVQVQEAEEPRTRARALASEGGHAYYRPAHHAAAACGVTSQLMSRLTGCVFVILGQKNSAPTETQHKTNIGLNLKFNKKNQEVSGYTRRCADTGAWLYSQRCIELAAAYVRRYPELLDMLVRTIGNDIFFESELWPGHVGEGKPQEVAEWLKQQPHASAVRRDCGSEALEPEEMLRLHRDILQQLKAARPLRKEVRLQVKINLVYKAELHEGNLAPDPAADFQLYDRVVCAAANLTVPLGAKGTVTAVYNARPANTVRLSDKLNSEQSYQVMFDEPFPGAMSEELFDTPTFYRLSGTHLLNISFGRKLRSPAGAAHQHDPYAASGRPNVLRSDDGHHSAFASYSSPTKERQTPDNHYQPIQRAPHAPPPPADTQELGTELLKSLLKISSPSTNSIAAKPPPENWRAKGPDGGQPPAGSMRNQQKGTSRSDNSNMTPSAQPGVSEPAVTPQNSARSRQVPGNQPQSAAPQLFSDLNRPLLPTPPHPAPLFPNFHNPNQLHSLPSAPRPFPNCNQNQPNIPQNKPNLSQNHPNCHLNQPNYPQSQPNFPLNQPNFPLNQPNFPLNQSNFPLNHQPNFPQSQPNFPHNQPNFPPNQPNFTINQSIFIQNQPNFTENQPSSQPMIANFAQSQRQTYGQNTGKYDRSPSSQPKGNVAFPKHLPAVGGQPLAPPTWNFNTPKQSEPVTYEQSKPSQESVGNPFVPLQVVAKQRRVRKPTAAAGAGAGGSAAGQPASAPDDSARAPAPAPAVARPAPAVAPHGQAAASSGSDPAKPLGRKRRSRIGANLPLL